MTPPDRAYEIDDRFRFVIGDRTDGVEFEESLIAMRETRHHIGGETWIAPTKAAADGPRPGESCVGVSLARDDGGGR
jgi:hypothetical protein